MEAWHDKTCWRPDLLSSGGMISCLNCGSFQVQYDQALATSTSRSSPGDRYAYQPLVSDTDFRLLTLYSNKGDEPIQCKLSLASISAPPEYDAMSYTWADESGNQERDSFVLLDGFQFPVTSNCVAALKRVISRGTSRHIWVDAICIDQEKDLEKNHQVRLMPQIYARAQSVLIYLGEPTPSERVLLHFLESGEKAQGNRIFLNKALGELFGRRWFSRVWVLQEVILSREALVVVGMFTLAWSSFQISRLQERGLSAVRWPAILQIQSKRTKHLGELLKLVDLARPTRASDPRDKVFAMLGFILDAEADGLTADYTRGTREVYSCFAEMVACKYGLPALFARSLWIEEPGASPGLGLDPWIPDWTQRLRARLPAAVREMLSGTPVPGSVPIRIDSDAGTLSFPACEVTSDGLFPSPPLVTGNTHFWRFNENDYLHSEVKECQVRVKWRSLVFGSHSPFSYASLYLFPPTWSSPGPALVRDESYLATRSPMSIYLLPSDGAGGNLDFLEDLEVHVSWNEARASRTTSGFGWEARGSRTGVNQSGGGFGNYVLCVVHGYSRKPRLYGFFLLSDCQGTLRANGGPGVLKQLTLGSDLCFKSRPLGGWRVAEND